MVQKKFTKSTAGTPIGNARKWPHHLGDILTNLLVEHKYDIHENKLTGEDIKGINPGLFGKVDSSKLNQKIRSLWEKHQKAGN